ncbi:hypothetical protein EDC96DRAFT_234279 [Choanephora cucurbitarum]|nr:hypothetical protein EDC96DRAFT_234279 [Choanephora cucurbitarum]
MASRLDRALDEVIKDKRRGDRPGRNDRNRRNETSFLRRQDSGSSSIRKRLGNTSSPSIRSFVRTVNVQPRGGRNVDGQWSHDLFDDDYDNKRNIMSRLGNSRNRESTSASRGVDISIENLHYDVTEKDVEELFSTVGEVLKAQITFDASGRSTGVARVRYPSMSVAEKAIEKYNNVELDGQAMRIQIKEYTPNERRRNGGGSRPNNRFDRNRSQRNSRNDRRDAPRNERRKENKTAEELDKEMDSYMQSTTNDNTAVEDTDMMLD